MLSGGERRSGDSVGDKSIVYAQEGERSPKVISFYSSLSYFIMPKKIMFLLNILKRNVKLDFNWTVPVNPLKTFNCICFFTSQKKQLEIILMVDGLLIPLHVRKVVLFLPLFFLYCATWVEWVQSPTSGA